MSTLTPLQAVGVITFRNYTTYKRYWKLFLTGFLEPVFYLFSIGVGVMIVLLSVGEAMLEQSRDVSLVGGGEVTVLPQGIDVEAMRTGGLGGILNELLGIINRLLSGLG